MASTLAAGLLLSGARSLLEVRQISDASASQGITAARNDSRAGIPGRFQRASFEFGREPRGHRQDRGANMPTRKAETTWVGGLQDGVGTVDLASSHLGTFEVSFPKRAAEDANGSTSPEELIAAAHSACYAMAL